MGRPKIRWEDLVQKDVESLGLGPNWKEKEMDREGWSIGCKIGLS